MMEALLILAGILSASARAGMAAGRPAVEPRPASAAWPDSVVAVVQLDNSGVGAVCCGSSGLYAYAASSDYTDTSSSTMNVISLSTFTVVDTVHAPTNWPTVSMTSTPDGQWVLMACDDWAVHRMRTSDNTYQGSASAGSDPADICSWPTSEYVIVSSYLHIDKIRVSDMAVVDTAYLGGWPWGVSVHPDGTHVYVARPDQEGVAVLDALLDPEALVDVQAQTFGVCCLPTGDYVYVTDSYNTVDVIRTSDNTWLGYIGVGASPRFLCSLPGGDYVYCANNGSNTVSVIQTSTNTVVDNIVVGANPLQLCSTPDGEMVLVACQGPDAVYAIGRSGVGVGGGGSTPFTVDVSVANPVRTGSCSATVTAGAPARVELRVYDVAGRLVSPPVSTQLDPGSMEIGLGTLLPGLYCVVAEAGGPPSRQLFLVIE